MSSANSSFFKLDSHRLNEACATVLDLSKNQELAGNRETALLLATLHDEIGGVADRLSFREARDAENFIRGPMMRQRDNVSMVDCRRTARQRGLEMHWITRLLLGCCSFAALVVLILVVPEFLR